MLHKLGREEVIASTAADDVGNTESASPLSVCNHTNQLSDGSGQPLGSWIATDTRHGIRYSCGGCGKLYGYQPNKKSDAEMYQAYLAQQRRLACPGCGEEPFLG